MTLYDKMNNMDKLKDNLKAINYRYGTTWNAIKEGNKTKIMQEPGGMGFTMFEGTTKECIAYTLGICYATPELPKGTWKIEKIM